MENGKWYVALLIVFGLGMLILFTVIENMEIGIGKTIAELLTKTFLIQMPIIISLMLMKKGFLNLIEKIPKTKFFGKKKQPASAASTPTQSDLPPVGVDAAVDTAVTSISTAADNYKTDKFIPSVKAAVLATASAVNKINEAIPAVGAS